MCFVLLLGFLFVFYHRGFLEEYLGILSTTPSLMRPIDKENKEIRIEFWFSLDFSKAVNKVFPGTLILLTIQCHLILLLSFSFDSMKPHFPSFLCTSTTILTLPFMWSSSPINMWLLTKSLS